MSQADRAGRVKRAGRINRFQAQELNQAPAGRQANRSIDCRSLQMSDRFRSFAHERARLASLGAADHTCCRRPDGNRIISLKRPPFLTNSLRFSPTLDSPSGG